MREVDAVRVVRLLVLLGVVLGVLVPVQATADEGPWGWPLAGSTPVVRAFAPPAVRYAAGHRGVDLAATAGEPVLAAGAGRVTWAGLIAGRGVVVVTHGALRTTYEPVTAAVPVGTAVALGEVVGTLEPGHLGCAADACLHWGLRRSEEYLDPVRLVERGPVRLLPAEGAGVAGARAVADAAPEAPGASVAGGSAAGGSVAGGSVAGGSVAGGSAAGGSAAGGSAAGRRVASPAPPLPPAVEEPGWSLRAAEAPLGAAAVAALVVGIGLLARPRPQPPAPVSGGVAAVALPAEPEPPAPPGELLDLDSARLRRRTG